MMRQKVFILQEKFTGIQIAVYHCTTKEEAQSKFKDLVKCSDNWIYIGTKLIYL